MTASSSPSRAPVGPIAAPTAAPPRAVRLPPLGRNYSKLWAATAVSNLGDGVRDAAFPLLAATLTRDPALVAGVFVAGRLPWLVFSLLSGAIVDRVDRRLLMGMVSVARAGVLGLLVAAVAAGALELPLVYAAAFLLGLGETLFDNAFLAITPALVPRQRIEAANGRLEAAVVVCNEFAGPPLGALLFTTAVALPFVLNGATFALAGILILLIGGTFRSRRVVSLPTTLRSDIGEGLRWLWGHRFLRTLTGMAAAVNLLITATAAIFVLFALEVLGAGALGFGLILSAYAGGGLLGGLTASSIARRLGHRRTIILVVGIAAVSQLVIGLTSLAVVAAGMLVAVSFAGSVWNVVTNSIRQRLVPDRLLGRVMSANRMVTYGITPIGALLGGATAAVFGLRAPYLAAAAGLALLALAATRLKLGGSAEDRTTR